MRKLLLNCFQPVGFPLHTPTHTHTDSADPPFSQFHQPQIQLLAMHIKTGTWESNNAVCESDTLCDPVVLVSPPQAEPHIRNRRLSPGSGSCGGGGGGCAARLDALAPHQPSDSPHHEGSSHGTAHTQPLNTEHRAQNRGRGPRREGAIQKLHKSSQAQKERWMGETLSSLRPPPAFPVKDSPAKLQPAVSYASKVKARGQFGGVAEEPPGIGALLQNQWGLSFITNGPPMENSVAPEDVEQSPSATIQHVAGEKVPKNSEPEDSAQLLLTCRHLVEAVQYHTQEWRAVFRKQKEERRTQRDITFLQLEGRTPPSDLITAIQKSFWWHLTGSGECRLVHGLVLAACTAHFS